MSRNRLRFVRSTRTRAADGQVEELNFQNGVNVLVGPPNAGKSKWLAMMNFVMGDQDSPEQGFGDVLAAKYSSAGIDCEIDGEIFRVYRDWRTSGKRGKVFVNEAEFTPSEFSDWLLEMLGIPLLHVPLGDPFAERRWPRLSWRMLLRHVYRQEWSWSDLADKQPPAEQHACLLQFLDLARFLYPPEYEELIGARKKLLRLAEQAEGLRSSLETVAKSVVGEIVVAGEGPEYLRRALDVIGVEMAALVARREALLEPSAPTENTSAAKDYGLELVELKQAIQSRQAARQGAMKRLDELQDHRRLIESEMARLKRALRAGLLMNALPVKSCPVCHQSVTPTSSEQGTCYLCNRPDDGVVPRPKESERRLQFEFSQLREEDRELDRLIGSLRDQVTGTDNDLGRLTREARRVEALLQSVRQPRAAAFSQEVALVDQDIGRLEERRRSLEGLLERWNEFSRLRDESEEVEEIVMRLQERMDSLGQEVDFESAGELLEGAFNDYVRKLNSGVAVRWDEPEVKVVLNERRHRIRVGGVDWKSRLGATLQCYLLMAYHYALLSLGRHSDMNYPGIAIVDLPPTLADGQAVADKENYLLEPFVDLANAEEDAFQLIVAGRAFENLEGAFRIELSSVWR